MISMTFPSWFIYLLGIAAALECVVALERAALLIQQRKLEKLRAANELWPKR